MSNARDAADLAVNATTIPIAASAPGVNPNLLDNSGFTVAQRGTSQAAWGGGEVFLDRWKNNRSGHGGVVTVSQDATGIFAAWGHDYCMKIDVTTAEASVGAGEYWHISQVLEAQDLQHLMYGNAAAVAMKLRFLIQSPKSGVHVGFINQPDGTRTHPFTFNVTSADTPEEIEVDIAADVSGTINNDTGGGLQLGFALTCGSNNFGTAGAWAAGTEYGATGAQNLLDNTANNLYIGGVKLEVGDTFTGYTHESYSKELDKCLRYYERFDSEGLYRMWVDGSVQHATYLEGQLNFAWKRTNPTVTCSVITNIRVLQQGSGYNCTSFNCYYITHDNCNPRFTTSGLTAGNGALAQSFQNQGAGITYIQIAAEL
jgi:hypothetical protein